MDPGTPGGFWHTTMTPGGLILAQYFTVSESPPEPHYKKKIVLWKNVYINLLPNHGAHT